MLRACCARAAPRCVLTLPAPSVFFPLAPSPPTYPPPPHTPNNNTQQKVGMPAVRLEGSMSLEARDRVIDEFTHDPKV